MQITRVDDIKQLAESANAWNTLAGGVPFRQWEWYATWWRHYGDVGKLYVLCIRDGGQLIGAAPWYVARHPAQGRVVRFLASGEVCSDYQTVLCLPGREGEIAAELASWLTQAAKTGRAGGDDHAWDLLDFSGIEAADAVMTRLLGQLKRRDNRVLLQPTLNCWRLALPATWEEFLGRTSKSHRGHLRRLERRMLASASLAWHTAAEEDLAVVFERLVDLHQRRWQNRGQPGAFASQRFTAFHRDVAREMLKRKQLRLHWLELAGQPAAAEYHFAGDGVIYVYQGGVEPELLQEEPGTLSRILFFKQAIAEDYRAIDFLRGDEAYKAHWRAEPRACHDVRVVPPRLSARLRDKAWMTGKRVKRWLLCQSGNVG